MELKPGYKLTEVGVIPEDWKVKSLQELADKITVGIASAATHAYRDRGVPLIRNQNIKPNELDDGDILYIAEDYESRFKNKRLQAGDLLTARTGYPGTTCIIPEKFESAQSFTTLITRPRKGVVNNRFLSFFINSDLGQNFFEQNQIGGGQKNVNAGTLRQLKIPVPPAKEQTAIATALSDVDELLRSLDRLIAKKRDIKQATMQQLLTGKTRLPGFDGEWKVERLGNSCELITKGTTPTSLGRPFTNSGVNFLKAESILENGEPLQEKMTFIDEATHKILERSQLKSGDLLISIAGVLGRVGRVSQTILPANTNQALAIIRLGSSSNLKQDFLFHSLRSSMTLRQITDVNVKGAQANISLQDVQALEIHVPPTIPEQAEIAQVLSDMDTEIATLEQRRDKTRALKQGMMQQLLTGRIRLKH
jgi:type I restriction enzyme S subunit